MSDATTVPSQEGSGRTVAILAHLSGIFMGWLVPLVLFLVKKSEPGQSFAANNAREALNFQLTVFIAYVVCFVLSLVLIGIFLLWIVILGNLILCIIAAVKASNGVSYRYPLCLRLIK
jgi:uncharacterized Tic20 family protein